MRLNLSAVHVGMTLLSPVSSLEAGIHLTNEHLRLLRFLKIEAIDVAPVEQFIFTSIEEKLLCEQVLQYEKHYNQWEERIAPNPYEGLEFIHQLFRQELPLSAVVHFFTNQPLRKNHVIYHAIYRALVARALSKYRGDEHQLQFDYGIASYFADASYAKIRKWSHMRYFTKMERELLYQHPLVSAAMLPSNQTLRGRVYQLITEHHERLDGSGFPKRLTERELNPASPLFIVADRFCQLTAPRTFRKPLSPEEAYFYMWQNKAYDEEALSLLATLLGFYEIGRTVLLSSGVRGKIHAYTNRIERPIVIEDTDETEYDLSRLAEVKIVSFQ
ncbi:metal-dependent phosphohydrolase [Exiguobacterium sp. MMG028]|uniref:HD-GYP domain-containing protein n=1 Tax=Exiguobacterium sp. MMG028 TaxID=3021979 RepID=UPI0022FDCDF0|nr:HD domain-containing phosphohydrolase [Exiguobacterium sp. MMG028]MDA5561191.1 metal-dependent phosphohydrolase [Exiguobacterium sp. MMG028]